MTIVLANNERDGFRMRVRMQFLVDRKRQTRAAAGRWIGLAALGATLAAAAFAAVPSAVTTVPGMPPVIDAGNLYSETGADRLSAAVRD
ncbi:MAG: hypothetical protein M9915_05615, partial [Rhizobacter sp.]|nr:hypothetical protein [Rhizobacter sp.]